MDHLVMGDIKVYLDCANETSKKTIREISVVVFLKQYVEEPTREQDTGTVENSTIRNDE